MGIQSIFRKARSFLVFTQTNYSTTIAESVPPDIKRGCILMVRAAARHQGSTAYASSWRASLWHMFYRSFKKNLYAEALFEERVGYLQSRIHRLGL